MSIEIVENHLFGQANLTRDQIVHNLETLAAHHIDFADIYFQSNWYESMTLEDRIIKDGTFHIDQGVGIRAVTGEKTGFAYSDQINFASIEQSALAARGIAKQGQNATVQILQPRGPQHLYPADNPLSSLDKQQKVQLLKELDTYIRAQEPLIKEVTISLTGLYERVLVAATDGTYAADVRPLVRLSISVLAQKGDRRERGSAGGGGRSDYHYFLQTDNNLSIAFQYANEAIRQARVNLEAVAAPAGTMPVVLGAGWPGVLLHEAVGHGLEGDFNRKGSSVFSGKIGEKVASEHCTIIDDGTMAGRRGSLNIDDEGVSSQHNVLIENGILKGYMQDKLNARLMGVAPTGNGRRESYASLPIPRMTNTYMLAGEHSPEAIIASIDKGLYAPHFAGGQVDITSGKFVFSTSEAYLIENGKISHPVKGATLIGSGIEVMQQVSMVGNDLALDTGIGVCGKDGQNVPVGVGQPTLKLDEITVGGTA